jgi:hypothetical protein
VGNPNDNVNREVDYGPLLAHNPMVGSYSAISVLGSVLTVNRVLLQTILAIDPLKGDVFPPLLDGRPPSGPDEIVLATRTLQLVHRRVGQSVQLGTPLGSLSMRVVGRMLAPSVGTMFSNGVGDGGWVSPAFLQKGAELANAGGGQGPPPFTIFAVRYAPGTTPAAAFASLRHDFGHVVIRQIPAEDAVNLKSVDRLPVALAALVVLLGVATVGNTLVTSVRRHRRDLAMLKTLGFVRRQVAATVAWQSTSFALVAVVVGLPIGVAAGRWAWSLVASGIGSVSPATVPAMAVAIVIPATILVANAIAAAPGWSAARVAPAVILRSE